MNIEVEYNIPSSIPGDIGASIFVNWEIAFEYEDESDGPEPLIVASVAGVRAEIGGAVFSSDFDSGVRPKQLVEWLRARQDDLTPDVIGMTREECLRECGEQDAA